MRRKLGNEGRYVLRIRAKSMSGFTMIELIVTMTIFAVLMALTIPTMKTWIANTKIRAVADTLQNGLRLAQTESLRRSRQVVFALTNSTNPQADFTAGTLAAVGNGGTLSNGANWVVVTIPNALDSTDLPVFIGSGVLTSAGAALALTVNGPSEVCFNSVGRLAANPGFTVPSGNCVPPTVGTPAGTPPKYTYQVTSSGGEQLNVQLALGGKVHLCDPLQASLASGNPYGC